MRPHRSLPVVLALTALASACGTRLPESSFRTEGATEVVPGDAVTTGDGSAATGSGVGTGASTGTADPGTGASATTGGSGATAGGGTTGGGTGGAAGGATAGAGSSGGGTGANEPNEASDVGVTATSIKIGNIVAVSGPLGDAFAPSQRGLQTWVAATNAKGGIRGRKIELVTCDDFEDRTRSLACAQKLVERDRVFAFVANNSRALGGAAPYINGKGVPDMAGQPITNAYYRFEHYWSMYDHGYSRDNKTVGWKEKLYTIPSGQLRWYVRNLGIRKAAVFYYGDVAESKQAGLAYAQALRAEGAQVTEFNVNFANPDFDQAINQMRRDGIDATWDTIDDGASRKFCDALQRANYTIKAKVSTIVAWRQSVGTTYGDKCRPVFYVTGDSRPWGDPTNAGAKEFREAYARYKPRAEMAAWAFEGWQAGVWFADALTAMGARPTRKGLEEWLRGLKDYTIRDMGTPRDYQPIDYDRPTGPDCYSIVQWSDQAKTFVLRAMECVTDAKHIGLSPSERGD